MTDKHLIIRLRRADAHAFKELYHKYIQKLYVFVLRTAKSPELAEDVVHDVFVKIWEHRDKLDPEQSFQAWLFTVARNHLLNLLKRNAHGTAITQEMIKQGDPVENSTLDLLLYNESSRLFHQAIELLPEKRRQIFELCHTRGLTYREAAHQLGITSSTVNSQMVKARKSIREHLHRENAIALPD